MARPRDELSRCTLTQQTTRLQSLRTVGVSTVGGIALAITTVVLVIAQT